MVRQVKACLGVLGKHIAKSDVAKMLKAQNQAGVSARYRCWKSHGILLRFGFAFRAILTFATSRGIVRTPKANINAVNRVVRQVKKRV